MICDPFSDLETLIYTKRMKHKPYSFENSIKFLQTQATNQVSIQKFISILHIVRFICLGFFNCSYIIILFCAIDDFSDSSNCNRTDCFWMFGRADSNGRPKRLFCWVRKLESKAHQWLTDPHMEKSKQFSIKNCHWDLWI